MDKVKIEKLDLFGYIIHENKALLAIFVVACIIVGVAFNKFLFFAVLFVLAIAAMRKSQLNKKYTSYSIQGKNKSFYLYSKILGSQLNTSNGQFSDKSIEGENYLEEFLNDFWYYCDWENPNEVESYKHILSHLKLNMLPNKTNNHLTSPQMNRLIENQYTDLMEQFDNLVQLKFNVSELYKTLNEINDNRLMYNMKKRHGRMQDLMK